MQHDRLVQFLGERELGVERVSLLFTRCVIVVRVEAALADGNGAVRDGVTNGRRIGGIVPASGIVGMDTGGKEDNASVALSQPSGATRRGG